MDTLTASNASLTDQTLCFDLRPAGAYGVNPNDSGFKITSPGVSSWQEFTCALEPKLADLARSSQSQSMREPGFRLSQWFLDALKPTQHILNEIDEIRARHHFDAVHIVLENQTELTPELMSVPLDTQKADAQPSHFWSSEADADSFLTHFLNAAPRRASLFASLQESVLKHEDQWFKSVEQKFIEHEELDADEFAVVKSSLWQEIKQLNDEFIQAALDYNWQAQTPTIADIVRNPISALCELNKTQSTGGVYSIGAGQMIAILDLTRQLADQDLLSLNTPLLADNRAPEPVIELQQSGQRQAILGDLWVNPEDRKPIAVHDGRLRQDLITKYHPDIIYLNVKAQALSHILTDDFCHFLAQLPYTPTLVMPSKSYTQAGEPPYLRIYRKLKAIKPELAQNLTVMGGFYAAPSILTGDLVHLTLASENKQAAFKLAKLICKKPCLALDTTVKDGSLQLEIQAGHEAAAMLMAGGANKNFLTYSAARQLLKLAFNSDHTQMEEWLETINQQIHFQRDHNVALSSDITRALLNHKDQTQSDPQQNKPSPGLVTDFVHCLPLTGRGICSIVEQSYRIQKHILRTPPSKRAEVAEAELKKLIESVRQDSLRLLGTRNARDGFIDELLDYFYHSWLTYKNKIPLTPLDKASFYQTFYPSKWQGEAAQEGRNGILPVIVKSSLLDIESTSRPSGQPVTSANRVLQWHESLNQIWQLYFPAARTTDLIQKQLPYNAWHKNLAQLLRWFEAQSQAGVSNSSVKLKEWCNASEEHEFNPKPAALDQLQQALADPTTLRAACQKILQSIIH